MNGLALVLLVTVLGGLAYIRFSPSIPEVWHPSAPLELWDNGGPWGEVVAHQGGATLRLKGDGAVLLAKLAGLADATPRTLRLAGSGFEGRITWITRSALIGFPDYTTAEMRPDGLLVWARSRFGRSDFGVNKARLQDWLARM